MTKPNFFIVGAPKCGTTAMDEYLRQHPDIFMAKKELHFFGSDIPRKERISKPEYLSHFFNIEDKKVIGESSVWYLYSERAAKEIYEFEPQAKILIMLRNPVTLLPSLHSQHIYYCYEDIDNFETAIQLDDARRKGRMQPRSVDFISLPPYKDVALFSEQVKRFLDLFDKKKVHIIIYEEFAKDPKGTTKSVLEFLEVNTELPIQYNVINPNRNIRFLFLHRLIKLPPRRIKQVVRFLIPIKKIRHRIMSFLSKKNISVEKRKEMSSAIKKHLEEFFADDISKLSKLISKDLTIWHNS